MDTLGTTEEERKHIKRLLKKKYGSIEIAAAKMNVSKFTVSRVLNGSNAEIETIVKILMASGHLEKRKYRYPAIDMSTFYFLNGILETNLFGGAVQKKGGAK